MVWKMLKKRSIGEKTTEALILILLIVSFAVTAYGIYGPEGSIELAGLFIPLILLSILVILLIKGWINPLMARLGIRNLIRHKSDSVIAIIGFMVGTSIICSSLVIGDTMTSLVESLIYENYHNVDEVIYLRESSGNLTVFNGEDANIIEDRILSIEEGETLIDGVSWEVDLEVAMRSPNSGLVEPSITLRAFSWETNNAFGRLYEGGREAIEPGPGEVFLTKNAADLVDAVPGDELVISSGHRTLILNYTHVLDQKERANFFGGETLYVSFSTAWSLMNISISEGVTDIGPGNWSGGYYNTLYISNRGDRVEGGELCDKVVPLIDGSLEDLEVPPGSGREIRVVFDKDSGVDMAMERISTFTKLFITLAAFSIIAGITLIVNIFVMLSEERREEMGISRAIGLRRSHLRSSYLFEGALYSFLSSFIGVIMGVLAAYGIIYLLEGLISRFTEMDFNILSSFSVVPLTLLVSFAGGFTITLGTTWVITQRIANLNIVSAIKGIPPPLVHTSPQRFIQRISRSCNSKGGTFFCALSRMLDRLLERSILWGLAATILGGFTLFAGYLTGQLAPAQIGVSIILIGVALFLRNLLPDRVVYTVTSILILILWSVKVPLFNSFSGGLEIFLFSGLFMVTSGVVMIVWNTDLLLFVITSIFKALGSSPAPIKMAISYPLKKRFRTGITIFMFALIIFTVTGTSMVVHIFNINISEFERSVGGGYDIIGISNTREIPDLQVTVEERWGLENSTAIDWTPTTSLTIGYVSLNISLPFRHSLEISYPVCGVTDDFKGFNTYGFNDVDWDLLEERGINGREDKDVWSILKEPDLVIVDSTLGENQFGPPGLGRKPGDVLSIILENGTLVEKKIAAITDQFAIRAIFTNSDIAASEYNTTQSTLHLIELEEGNDPEEVSDGLRRSLIDFGFITIDVREFVKEILKFQNSFFDLFNAYLSLGLIIGIVGLGIVTLRSVYERRHEIGMMRAIGFKKRAVLASFLGESTFIASSGIILGSVMGVILGWNLWREEVSSDLPLFGIPVVRILIVGGIALTFALLSCIPPSRMATKVSPAEALRYE